MDDGFIKKINFKKKTKFIDVGANIGQTLIKVKSIDPDLEYIGFEPNPSCVHYLSKLISLNQFDNTHVLPIALSTEDEILELDHYNESIVDSSASIIKDFRPKNKVFRKSYIASMSINIKSSLNLIKNCSIIKIDVEGSELEVLKSLYEILETYKPIVIIEILPIYSFENEGRIQRQEQIFSILKNLSFMIFRILKSNNDFKGLKEINEIEIHNDLELCDYVLVHKHFKENFYKEFNLSI